MRRTAQAVLLLLLGGMMLKLVVTGSYDRYVRGVHAPLLAVAGVGLVVIAVATLWRSLSRSLRSADEPGVDEADVEAPGRRVVRFGIGRREGSALFGGGWAEPTAKVPLFRPGMPSDDPTWPGVRVDLSDVERRAAVAGWAAAEHEGFAPDAPPSDSSSSSPAEPAAAGTAPAAAADSSATVSLVPPAAVSPVSPAGGGLDPADPFDAAPEPSDVGALSVAGATRSPGTRIGWLLVAAALAVLVLAPPALGVPSATRAGAAESAGDALAPLPADDPVSMSFVEYAGHAAAGGVSLTDRRVVLVGFVVVGARGEPYLTRWVLGCCAAGARPLKVGLAGNLPGVLTAGQWLRVVGAYTPETSRDPVTGAPIPYLSVVTVEEIAPPENPYET